VNVQCKSEVPEKSGIFCFTMVYFPEKEYCRTKVKDYYDVNNRKYLNLAPKLELNEKKRY